MTFSVLKNKGCNKQSKQWGVNPGILFRVKQILSLLACVSLLSLLPVSNLLDSFDLVSLQAILLGEVV